MEFYVCNHCGNIIAYAQNSGVPVMCCGQKMQELVPGVVEASKEKHIPVVSIYENKVTVNIGSVAHPMTDEHYIQWVALETKEGNQRKELHPIGKPQAEFMICDEDEVLAVYTYCNLHGLWKLDLAD